MYRSWHETEESGWCGIEGLVMDGKGYGSAGASRSRRSTKGFLARSGSPREDIDFNNYTLRQRGRLLYMGNSVAASGIKTHRTNTIGIGLKPNPRPDLPYLNMAPEAGARWIDNVKREFALWADRKTSCDATGINSFYDLQQMLFTSWLTTGDVFVLVENVQPTWREPYSLRLNAVEGDLVATPEGTVYGKTTGRNPDNGNRIFDGVEVDSNGRVVAYWFRNTYPYELSDVQTEYKRVEAIGKATGLPNVLHIISTERPDQYRGVGLLSPVVIPLLQLNRYTEAELTAAIIGSFMTAFITTETPEGVIFNEADPQEEGAEGVSDDPNEYEMGAGTINYMKPGEDIKQVDPTHPTTGYDAFVNAMCSQIGAALEIPRELLLKQFTSSYSASRGALLEAWKSFKTYRQWFVDDFCRPVYELWMTEAVARGRISAPGYFNNPAIREAWLSTQWIGPSQGQLDPVKEVNAEILACQNGFSTREDSALRINGSDFDTNVQRLIREAAKMAEIAPVQTDNDNDNDEEDDRDA